MFIQFGYVTLFSSAYPLAGLCALLNNLIEIRGDAFKLCFVHQRPFGARVNSIGSWQVSSCCFCFDLGIDFRNGQARADSFKAPICLLSERHGMDGNCWCHG